MVTNSRGGQNLLIVLGYTAITSFAVLASQGHADHTWNAKVRLVKFPQAQKFIDDGLLLSEAAKLRDEPWFVEHRAKVEISAKGIRNSESNIAERVGRKCSWYCQRKKDIAIWESTDQGEYLLTTVGLPKIKCRQIYQQAKAIHVSI